MNFEDRPPTEAEALWALFHRLWTRDVGRDGYDKTAWLDLERRILALLADDARLRALDEIDRLRAENERLRRELAEAK